MELAGKVVLITGASRGLGRTLVDLFAEADAAVAFCSRRMTDLAPIEDALNQAGHTAMAIPCDVRVEGDVVRMVHRVVHRFGRLDAVINNASILGPRAPIPEYPLETWRNVLDTNLTGTYLVCREAAPCMARGGGGSIINVSNSVTNAGHPEWGAYLVSKSGVEGFSLMLANELRPQGIRVNVVDPNPNRSDARNATLRSGDPRAEIFLWLASSESGDVTGQRLRASEYEPSEAAVRVGRA